MPYSKLGTGGQAGDFVVFDFFVQVRAVNEVDDADAIREEAEEEPVSIGDARFQDAGERYDGF